MIMMTALKRNTNGEVLSTSNTSNITYWGYLPLNIDLSTIIIQRSTLDSISRFLLIVAATSSNESYTRMSSYSLINLLGKKYLVVLSLLESKNIIVWKKEGSLYSGIENEKNHNSFRIVEAVRFRQHKITSTVAKKRVLKHQVIPAHNKALIKAYSALKSTNIPSKSKNFNHALKEGAIIPKQDIFGRRIHSPITNIKSLNRSEVKYLRMPTHQVVEVDIKASHPYYLIQFINFPEVLTKIFDEKYLKYAEVFNIIPKQEKIRWFKMYFRGDFYENLAELFSGSNWVKILKKKLKKDGKQIPSTHRSFAKSAFMYLINGMYPPLIKILATKFPVSTFVFKFICSCNIPFISKELTPQNGYNKKYEPYKNLAIFLQRTEASLLQMAYTDSNTWGHMIHDSILCTQIRAETFKRAIEKSNRRFFRSPPKVTIKN